MPARKATAKKAPTTPRRKKGIKTGGAAPVTRVAVVLDQSGSMESIKEATITGFNEFLATLRKDNSTEVLVSLTRFSHYAQIDYTDVPLKDVKNLGSGSYRPGGTTALYDAVGQTLVGLGERASDATVVVIITDGLENASQKYDRHQVMAMIQERTQGKGAWSFVYLGANQNAWANAQAMGIPQGNAATYTADTQGMLRTFGAVGQSLNTYRMDSARLSEQGVPVAATAALLVPDKDPKKQGRV